MFTRIRRWLGPPSFEGDEEKSRAAMVLNLVIWILIIAAVFYGILAPIQPGMEIRRIIIIVPFLAVMFLFKQMVNWGLVRLTGILTVFSVWLLLTYAMVVGADYNNPAYMGYLLVIICAGLILNWRASIWWSFVCILTSAIILLLGLKGVLPSSSRTNPPVTFWIAQSIYIFTSAILLSEAIRKIDEAFAKAQHELNERKRVEAEREKIIKELEAKNAELERFTYTVSHDLKSPLITISGFIGLLEADARSGNENKFQGDLQRIGDAAEKMKRLLDELLELSRIGRLMNPPSDVAFEDIVRDALALVRGRLQAGNIEVDVQKKLPVVNGDRRRLVEVVQNLIDNAAKFMGDQPSPKIEIGARKEETEQVFFVKDNGIGLEHKYHEKIFGLFDKLDPHSEGTGIGLSLVRRIVEVHGGRIWVESEGLNKGSTFYFTLPVKT